MLCSHLEEEFGQTEAWSQYQTREQRNHFTAVSFIVGYIKDHTVPRKGQRVDLTGRPMYTEFCEKQLGVDHLDPGVYTQELGYGKTSKKYTLEVKEHTLGKNESVVLTRVV